MLAPYRKGGESQARHLNSLLGDSNQCKTDLTSAKVSERSQEVPSIHNSRYVSWCEMLLRFGEHLGFQSSHS